MNTPAKYKISDYLLIAVLIISVLVGLWGIGYVSECISVVSDENSGDARIGAAVISMVCGAAGFFLLCLSLPFAIAARNLHKGYRIFAVILPLVYILTGAILFFLCGA